ncbi:hypothetical protein HK097_008598 [Rhizophlyctis rosea]|uniref:FAD-binding domain-containing protein n=1 Tax=Rhizophlyctis rosea TaxID=64517 RepID=A0AAD5X1L9_9FUNG|nr:hypothetical protein HK097_008598 [Rhizophlyctis rosea]
MAQQSSPPPNFHIIGGGPVGFLTALLLAKEGYHSTVYERTTHIPDVSEDSYPIGVNPRGLNALAEADPALADRIRNTGRLISSLQVWGPNRRYATIESGVVYGTSRFLVNLVLWEAAKHNPKIVIKFAHKLKGIDFASKRLTFDVLGKDGSTTAVNVDASSDRVVAADGANSVVRSELQNYDQTFLANTTPWSYTFRVLFAPPNVNPQDLDPSVHYIFRGAYTAVITNKDNQPQWTCVLSARHNDPPQKRSLVLSQSPTPSNVTSLHTLAKSLSPNFAALLTPTELTSFFSRRTFRGSIVSCNRLNHSEWLVLLGDAAHSIVPPVGEGINSGLQDCAILVTQCLRSNLSTAFSTYNSIRLKDLNALTEYALYQNTGPKFRGEVIARRMFMIVESSWKPNIGEMLFGPKLDVRKGYEEIIGRWRRKKRFILPICRVLAYPVGAFVEVLVGVWRVGRWILGRMSGKGEKDL